MDHVVLCEQAFDLDALGADLVSMGCEWGVDWDGNDRDFLLVTRGGLRIIAYPFDEIHVTGSSASWGDLPILAAIIKHVTEWTE